MCDLKKEPKIDYPVFWDYKVIFEVPNQADEIFKEIVGEKSYRFERSHLSKNAKYQSYLLSVYVESKKERLDIFEKLKVRAKFVL
nr:DUF493 family protein [Campylobacter bilis]